MRFNMGTEKINRLKIVLVEQGKNGKWLAKQLGRMKRPFHVGVLMRPNPYWKLVKKGE